MHIKIVVCMLFFIASQLSCMDKPCLQEQTDLSMCHIQGDLYISSIPIRENYDQKVTAVKNSAFLTSSAFLTKNRYHYRLLCESYQGEPFLLAKIFSNNGQKDTFKLVLPARYFYGLGNRSRLKLILTTMHSNPEKYCFDVVCNSTLGQDFKQRFEMHMNNFYKEPFFYLKCKEPLIDYSQADTQKENQWLYGKMLELINKGLVDNPKCDVKKIGKRLGSTGAQYLITYMHVFFNHGSNGISSKEKFIQMMVNVVMLKGIISWLNKTK